MRGFLQPALKKVQSDNQKAFAALSRHRREQIAEAAQTDLVKASQWSRGGDVAPALAEALEKHLAALLAKKK